MDDGRLTYANDSLYRLTSVTYPGPTTDTYTYDAIGNRPAKNATTCTYDNADEMTAVGAVAYTYDANGNQTGRGTDTFTCDHENRRCPLELFRTPIGYDVSGRFHT